MPATESAGCRLIQSRMSWPERPGHDIEQPGRLDVDEHGRHLRAQLRVGVLEGVLVRRASRAREPIIPSD
jgi:hypothetical protein